MTSISNSKGNNRQTTCRTCPAWEANMAAKTDRLVRLAGMLLLPAAVILQANAQQQNMQNMPGMQMSSGKADMKDDMQDLPTGPAVKLDDLEQMALSRNPTFSQANADVRVAEGTQKQAGLYPNPTVGYYGDEIRGGAFRSGKEGAFVNQTIVLGGKLSAARQTAEQQRLQAVTNVDAQRYRVLNTVRSLYYEVLAAQRLLPVRPPLPSLADDAVQTSYQPRNLGQADQPQRSQAAADAQ